ncbi:hypothetical protein B0F90DRAFT_1921616 [Multifurca ochricompacta]|uniref:Secreted protein n=1 Tax=Multifurca ochricompacta TaxID=376703 RepID=A0AAD4LVD4_9AGAM|nr:hypothetical protein B0F90DRAFT_1921616 [Multifurca ochricompacta]
MLQVWIQVSLLWFWGWLSGSLASGVHSVVYLDHNQAAVSTSTTTKQRNQAAVNTSTTTKQGIGAAVRNCVGDRVGASLPSQDSRSQQEQIQFKPTTKSEGTRVRFEVDGRDSKSCNKFKMMKALQVTSWRVQVGFLQREFK